MTQPIPTNVSHAAEAWYACCSLAAKFPGDERRQSMLHGWYRDLSEKLTALDAQLASPATDISPFTIYWNEVAIPVTNRHQIIEGRIAAVLVDELSRSR